MEITEILKVIIWPLTLFLFLIFFTLLFRVQIRELLKKVIVRYKRGDTEVEVIQQVVEIKAESEKQIAGDSISLPSSQESTPRV
jgi:hypothetical protein